MAAVGTSPAKWRWPPRFSMWTSTAIPQFLSASRAFSGRPGASPPPMGGASPSSNTIPEATPGPSKDSDSTPACAKCLQRRARHALNREGLRAPRFRRKFRGKFRWMFRWTFAKTWLEYAFGRAAGPDFLLPSSRVTEGPTRNDDSTFILSTQFIPLERFPFPR
jgi:hypothetical protein